MSIPWGKGKPFKRTGQGCVMFNTVMQAYFLQVERILAITFVQHICTIVRHEEAERRRKVVSRSDDTVHFFECNIAPISW